MKTICLYFEIHQIIHLRRYRFFDIGRDHYYYDDYENERSITDIAERSYVPALNALIQMAKENPGYFKVAVSLSGVGLEQLEIHAPQVLDLLGQLNDTGSLEFLCEPYSHGLAALGNEESFRDECNRLKNKIKEMYGQTPKVFRNSSLIYSDDIGALVADMGFEGVLTEGAKQVLGWKSPHFVYENPIDPRLKVLLRDYKLSDDISLRFSNTEWSEYPLFADKYMDWIASLPQEEEVINIFMELSALGIFQPLSSNILEFLKALPKVAKDRGISFSTPSEVIKNYPSVGAIDVPYNVSWVDEERDTSCWLGNDMQREAFNKLYSVADRVRICTDRRIKQDWDYLQASNNFRFMTTKHNSVGMNRGIYDSPFDAFTNYMNILGDFISRVNNLYPTDMDNEELNSLLTTIQNQDEEIAAKDREIEKLQKQLEKYNPSKSPELKADKEKKATVKKEPEKKAPVKKAAKKEPEKKAPAKKAAKKAEPEEKPKAKKAKK
jgi:alpha-amylase